MAGKLRYWKEKDGRFWARIAVPVNLRPFLDNPRSELIEPLGGDRRLALRLHSAAVARLQLEVAAAKQRESSANPKLLKVASPRTPIATADFGRAVWQRYSAALEADDANRERFPSKAEIDAEYDRLRLIPFSPVGLHVDAAQNLASAALEATRISFDRYAELWVA
ncbi:hypothetical protein, partial [Cypionkella sp. TWP1-2-1b2]|uniref:hypothetical protein n=1 Tax=Cypionkella sp. TWP1-2-1b2 TaxID=2804675 RepID=UPI003CF05364